MDHLFGTAYPYRYRIYQTAAPEILTEHLRYIDYAVEYCEMTELLPRRLEIPVDVRNCMGCKGVAAYPSGGTGA